MTPKSTIEAKHYVAPRGRIVDSASRLADEVVRQLGLRESVSVDLREMRGLSSSYFNVLLQRVIPVTTLAKFPHRVEFIFDSPAQEQVLKRSLEYASRTVV